MKLSNVRTKAEINITPLVDVVLVLLILFMILTPISFRGYDVAVPVQTAGTPPFRPIFIKQEREDSIVLDQNEVALEDFGTRLSSLLNARRDKNVVFWGADDLGYGQVAKTLDLIHQSGVQRIIVLTDHQLNKEEQK